MGWTAYKQDFSSGPGDWIYYYFPFDESDEDLKEFKIELDSAWNWSEHFRGTTVKRVLDSEVPRNEFDERIKTIDRNTNALQIERRQLMGKLLTKQIGEFNHES